MKRKILYIVSRLDMGGIENMILNSIPYLEEKYDISILCNEGGGLDDRFKSLNIELIPFKSKNPVLQAVSLWWLLRERHFDVVHSHFSHTSGLLAIVTHYNNTRFFVSVHNEKVMFKPTWDQNILLRLIKKSYLDFHKNTAIKFARRILGHSQVNLTYYNRNWGNFPEKYAVIHNGIDFKKFQNLQRSDEQTQLRLKYDKIFIHVGSFKEQKNHDLLIDIFNAIDPVKNKYFLILVGDGKLLKSIKEKVSKLSLDKNVLFTGMDPNICKYMSISDVFIFPSLYEGFGNVLIEAQYFNLKIVASNITPHYEAVYHQFHKDFFQLDSLSDAVSKTLSVLNANNRFQEEAYEFAKHFSMENMVNEQTTIYEAKE